MRNPAFTLPGIPVIIDTDLGSDSDDLFDVTTACQYQLNASASGLAVYAVGATVLESISAKFPGACDVVTHHMGIAAPQFGSYKGSDTTGNVNHYASFLYDNFAHPEVGLASTVTDVVTVYRTVLHQRKAWIIGIAPANVLDALLKSAADGVDSRSGVDLITAQCLGLIWVAGNVDKPFVTGSIPAVTTGGMISQTTGTYVAPSAEFDINDDKVASNHLLANWPATVRLIKVDIGLGDQMNVGTTVHTALPSTCPVRRGYETWADTQGAPYNDATYTHGRNGWSQPAFDFLTNPARWRTFKGTWTSDATTGIDTFTYSAGGNHEILTRAEYIADLETIFENLVVQHAT